MGNLECLADPENKKIYKYDSNQQGWSDRVMFRLSGLSSMDVQEQCEQTPSAESERHDHLQGFPMAHVYNLQRRSTIRAAMSAANKTLPSSIGERTETYQANIAGLSTERNDDQLPEVAITRHEHDQKVESITISRKNTDGTYKVSTRNIKQMLSSPRTDQADDESMTFTVTSIDRV